MPRTRPDRFGRWARVSSRHGRRDRDPAGHPRPLGRPVRPAFARIAGDRDEAQAEEAEREPRTPVWSVVCFYIDRRHRGSGVASALLEGAIGHARAQGAKVLEAYPIEPEGRTDDASAFTGLRSMFRKAGFREVGRFDRWRSVPRVTRAEPPCPVRPPGRPVMRLEL